MHRPPGGAAAGDIVFEYVFSSLNLDDEADFLGALVPDGKGKLEAHITIRYSEPDKGGRLRAKRWCGEHEDVGLTADMMENLRGVYLPPLRDASQGLKPGAPANWRDCCSFWQRTRESKRSTRRCKSWTTHSRALADCQHARGNQHPLRIDVGSAFEATA